MLSKSIVILSLTCSMGNLAYAESVKCCEHHTLNVSFKAPVGEFKTTHAIVNVNPLQQIGENGTLLDSFTVELACQGMSKEALERVIGVIYKAFSSGNSDDKSANKKTGIIISSSLGDPHRFDNDVSFIISLTTLRKDVPQKIETLQNALKNDVKLSNEEVQAIVTFIKKQLV